jgi:uncharacterized membrane protein
LNLALLFITNSKNWYLTIVGMIGIPIILIAMVWSLYRINKKGVSTLQNRR